MVRRKQLPHSFDHVLHMTEPVRSWRSALDRRAITPINLLVVGLACLTVALAPRWLASLVPTTLFGIGAGLLLVLAHLLLRGRGVPEGAASRALLGTLAALGSVTILAVVLGNRVTGVSGVVWWCSAAAAYLTMRHRGRSILRPPAPPDTTV